MDYCLKCKKRTPSKQSRLVKHNKTQRLCGVCTVCNKKKSKFIGGNMKLTEAIELHRPAITKFKRRRIITLGIDDLWACDLVIMSKYEKQNDGFKYMLNVIDTFSKFAWIRPLKSKSGSDVAHAFQDILEEAKTVNHSAPNLLHCDKGTEFRNAIFKKVLQSNGIKMYHTENEEKSAIIERFNRTLNHKMKIQFEMNKNFRWIHIVPHLLREYNYENVHTTIRMTPSQVNTGNEKQLLNDVYYYEVGNDKPTFNIGDRVRITRKKEEFQNKYQSTWRREIFIIDKILNTNPVTYKLKDLSGDLIIGSFYRQELQKSVF